MTLADLERLRGIAAEIAFYDEKAQILRSRAERLTAIRDGMPHGSPDRDEMAEIVAAIIDNERKAGERLVTLYTERETAERWIDGLPEQQRLVMRAYFIDGAKTWQDVAERLPYSYRHCLRIKDAALRTIEES